MERTYAKVAYVQTKRVWVQKETGRMQLFNLNPIQ